MADHIEVVEDNRDEVKEEIVDAVYRAFYAVGLEASGDVAQNCPVDTGLLRNSITFAVSGHPPEMESYTSNAVHADTPATQRAGTAGKPVNPPGGGSYSGGAVRDGGKDDYRVFIGSNVEYAAYVEYGTSNADPQPFLRPTLQKNSRKYIRMLSEYLEKNIT